MLFNANDGNLLSLDNISSGTAVTVESTACEYEGRYNGAMRVVMLSATTGVMIFKRISTFETRVVAFTISGSTITTGTVVSVGSAILPGLDIAVVSSSKFIVSYQSAVTALILKTYTVSGTTITLDATSSPITVGSGGEASGSLCMLSSTRGIVSYTTSGTQWNVKGFTVGTSSLSIDATAATITVVGDVDNVVSSAAIIKVSSTQAFLIYPYSDVIDIYQGVVTDSGTALSFSGAQFAGRAYKVSGGTPKRICGILNNSTLLIHSGGEHTSTTLVGSVSGTTVTWKETVIAYTNGVRSPYSVGGMAFYSSSAPSEVTTLAVIHSIEEAGNGLQLISGNATKGRPQFGFATSLALSYKTSSGSACDIALITGNQYIVAYCAHPTGYPTLVTVTA